MPNTKSASFLCAAGILRKTLVLRSCALAALAAYVRRLFFLRSFSCGASQGSRGFPRLRARFRRRAVARTLRRPSPSSAGSSALFRAVSLPWLRLIRPPAPRGASGPRVTQKRCVPRKRRRTPCRNTTERSRTRCGRSWTVGGVCYISNPTTLL